MATHVTLSPGYKHLVTSRVSVIIWTILFCPAIFRQHHAMASGVLESTIVQACNLTSLQNHSAVCTCTQTDIRCHNRELANVPANFMASVEVIDLSFNLIREINDTAFVGLELLRTLYLQNNLISTIDPYAFKNLFRLSILNLENNRLTVLDPTQNLFQHLPSLTRLNVQNNNITSIKRLSFLTVGSAEGVVVKFDGNPINCNCDVLALRKWVPTLTTRKIEFVSLICDNDPEKRPYDQTNEYYFGPCNDTGIFDNSTYSSVDGNSPSDKIKKDKANNRYKTKEKKEKNNKEDNTEDSSDVEDDGGDSAYQGYQCPVCSGERTSYACKQKKTDCPDSKKMCHMTFAWNSVDNFMSISSGCDSYDECLKQEMNNNRTCVQNNNRDINCNFCCLGPTCVDSSIGGRTKDLEFILTYIRDATTLNNAIVNNHSSQEFKQEEHRIATGLLSDISDFQGGIDIYVSKFEPIVSKQQVRVFLKLELTVLSTVSDSTAETEIKSQITNSISSGGFLYKENIIDDSLYLSHTEEAPCPKEIINNTKGIFVWNQTYVGDVPHIICPKYPTTTVAFASRACLLVDDIARWANMDDSNCSEVHTDVITGQPTETMNTTVTTTTATLNITVNPVLTQTPTTQYPVPQSSPNSTVPVINITSTANITVPEPTDDPTNESSSLIDEIQSTKNFTPELVNKFVQMLERLTTKENLAKPRVVKNVMSSINSLVDVDDKVLRQSEQQLNTSSRLLMVIEHVPQRAPLANGSFKEVTKNIAVAALAVNETESRNIHLVAATNLSEEPTDKLINISYSDNETNVLPNSTTITIPTQALAKSLSPDQRMLLERVSFSVHQSDKLFYTVDSTIYVNTLTASTPASVNTDGSETKTNQNRTAVFKVNSNIISASIPNVTVENLSDNITMIFMHSEQNASNPHCVFWDEKDYPHFWSTKGCGVVETNDVRTVCGCNHMTNFALLMDVFQEGSRLSELDKQILSIISYVGCAISLAALLLTLMTYTFFRKLRRDNPSKILINLCLALLASNLVYLVGMQDYTFSNTASCKAVAVLLHYFLLSSLMWMAVEAFYMYLALVRVFKAYFTHFILKCCLVGWGVPLAVVIITLAVNTTGNYGLLNSGLCWLHNPAFYAAFVGPVCAIILINCLTFALVIRQLMSMSSSKLNKTDKNSTVQRLRGAVGVVILLGLSWIFAIFAIDQASVAFYYLFAIFNSLQGLFIFIFYCLLKKDAMTAWKRICPCFDEYREQSKSSSHSRTKSVFTSTTNKNRLSVVTLNGTSTSTLPPDSRKNSYLNVINSTDKIDLSDININTRKISFAPSPTIPEYTTPESPVLSEKDSSSFNSVHQVYYDEMTSPKEDIHQVQHSKEKYYEVAKDKQPFYNLENFTDVYNKVVKPKVGSSDEVKFNFEGGASDVAYSNEPSDYVPEEQIEPDVPSAQKESTDVTYSQEPSDYVVHDELIEPDVPSSRKESTDDVPESRRTRVEGEIDTSHIGPVQVIKLKFERTVSDTSDIEKTNI